jgi:hypothetical protein
LICAFLPERHKNSRNPVNPVKKDFEFKNAKLKRKFILVPVGPGWGIIN